MGSLFFSKFETEEQECRVGKEKKQVAQRVSFQNLLRSIKLRRF